MARDINPTFSSDQYELLDFGDGRKLERFGRYVFDRPSPAADDTAQARPKSWMNATARYERAENNRGVWQPVAADLLPGAWTIRHGPLVLELKTTDFGHLGLFPEQAPNWSWLAGVASEAVNVLNLFAYTGASTLAAAAAGARVTHVDAARNVVDWARRNAAASGLAEAPIRWICDDALTFSRREVRRGNHYDAVILDPPSYGHGPKGQPWKLEHDLPELLAICGQLTHDRPAFMLLTCHSPGCGPDRLAELLTNQFDRPATGDEMVLTSTDGRKLASGARAAIA